MKDLYLENGYLNIPAIMAAGCPFNFVIGARGIGKTYGAIDYAIDKGEQIIFLRRQQTQLELINTRDFSPFGKNCEDRGIDFDVQAVSKYSGAVYLNGEERPIAYNFALSTVSNVRGFNAAGATGIIYDEFIPEAHARPIKHEFEAFLNAYETMNRNRELNGEPAMWLLALSNSEEAATPIFVGLSLVERVIRMKEKGVEQWIDKARGIQIIYPQHSPISEAKKATALYKLAAGTDYEKMALENAFDLGGHKNVSRPLKELRPLVAVGELCFYSHKSDGRIYVMMHTMGTPEHFSMSDVDISRFKKQYRYLIDAYFYNRMEFENYTAEALTNKIMRKY